MTKLNPMMVNTRIDQPMEHDIHLGQGGLGEYHVPWVEQSLYSPHGKSLICIIFNLICIYIRSPAAAKSAQSKGQYKGMITHYHFL
jgi:hypothetical protein